MADNKAMEGKQDNSPVDFNDPSEVEHLHRQVPNKQHSQIVDAIIVADPSRTKIVRYLQGKA